MKTAEEIEKILFDIRFGEKVAIERLIASIKDIDTSIWNVNVEKAISISSEIRIILKQHDLRNDNVALLLNFADEIDLRFREALHATGQIRIFLSSPGDVSDERQLAIKIIQKLHNDPVFKEKISLDVVAWDKADDSTPLLATLTPQEAINQGLAVPSDCDIVVVILWSRLGTPLPLENYQKADGSQYLSGTEWEFEEAMAASKKGGIPIVVVYRRLQEPRISLNDKDLLEKIKQYERVKLFFEQFFNPDGSISQGYNTYNSPSDFEDLFELHLRKLIVRILDKKGFRSQKKEKNKLLEEASNNTMVIEWPKEKSPFPGLRPFTTKDHMVYFGRGREIDQLVDRLREPNCNFLAIVGASGSGKSSLVRAGLIPRIQNGAIEGSRDWIVVSFTPDELGLGEPFASMAAALMRDLPDISDINGLAFRLGSDTSLLTSICEKTLQSKKPWAEILIFIDQFEEVFTRIDSFEKQNTFVNLIRDASKSAKIKIVVTMRSDFYYHCAELPTLANLLKEDRNSTFPLSAPVYLSLYEMITKPVGIVGLAYEDGLPHRILDDTGDEPGALPLMAFALQQIWEQQSPDGKLTHKAYENFGGVQGAIGKQAQETFDLLSTEAQSALTKVFKELVEVDERGTATRKRTLLKEIQRDNATEQIITALTKARLLVQSRDEDDRPMVEVAHEALFMSWPRLRDWITLVQDDLIQLRQARQAATQWAENNFDKAFLWYDERLQLVYSAIKTLQPNLDEITTKFIRPEAERLLDEINDIETNHFRRAAIGDRLAEIGDNRAGVGLNEKGLPDIVWCDVPGGEISIFDNDGKNLIKGVEVKAFKISKYPITYLQYKSFLGNQNGFSNEQWWKGLAKRETEPGKQNRPTDNCPAENVSWFDAIAFCRWLSDRLGYQILLPFEWEWQHAATSSNPENIYPWGKELKLSNLNVGDSGLARTTAVGMYPNGKALNGALDLSGNIQEWCVNEYDNPESANLFSDKPRSMRGGSWSYMDVSAKATYRYKLDPETRFGRYGIRLITRESSV